MFWSIPMSLGCKEKRPPWKQLHWPNCLGQADIAVRQLHYIIIYMTFYKASCPKLSTKIWGGNLIFLEVVKARKSSQQWKVYSNDLQINWRKNYDIRAEICKKKKKIALEESSTVLPPFCTGEWWVTWHWTNSFCKHPAEYKVTHLTPVCFINSGPGVIYLHQYTGGVLFQVMTYHWWGAKPLPEPMLPYC